MDRNIKIVPQSNKSKDSVNENISMNVDFNSSFKLLPLNDLNYTLDIGEQFNKEREECKTYRILGKISTLASNVLFNTTTNDSWSTFNTDLFKNSLTYDDVEITFENSINKHLKEINGWYGYFNPVLTNSGLCTFYDMEPKRERFFFTPDITNVTNVEIKNWELTITYPYKQDEKHYLVNDGLLIINKEQVFIGGKEMVALYCPVKHNLVNGSFIKIKNSNKDGIYEIKRIGLDNGDKKENYFCIDLLVNDFLINENTRFSKMYDNIESKYYFRIHKKIKTTTADKIQRDDYQINKLAFSETIFTDDIFQYVFNEDIDVTDLVDNLGRPLTSLFLTIIKTDSNGIFTNVSSGIEGDFISTYNATTTYPNLLNIPIIQKIHSTNISDSYTPLNNNVRITDDDFYGDVVEYNINTLNEVVLSSINHRFNTNDREYNYNAFVSGPRPEGYYYQTHYELKIRQFSSYIEEGDDKTEGMPDYKTNLNNGKYIWRDILSIGQKNGINESVSYPFLNGKHYLYNNISFKIKRQDPFDNWDMFHSEFPADPIGNTMNNKFMIKKSDNVC